MEESLLLFTSLALFLIALLSNFIKNGSFSSPNRNPLPPSPPSLPIIGHLHLLRNKQEPLHRILHNLTEKYGPVLFLRLGFRNMLVVSSPSAVEECFTKNDVVFANRPRSLAGKHLNYNFKSIIWAPYGDHWRTLRRLTTMELFTSKQLAMLARLRRDEICGMLRRLVKECGTTEGWVQVNLRDRLHKVSYDILLQIIAGKRDEADEEARRFSEMVKELKKIHGSVSNLNDFFPVLQLVDFQGVEKRMRELMKKMDGFYQSLIDNRRKMRRNGCSHEGNKPTLIDIMLNLQEQDPKFYTDETLKAVITSLLRAGIESSSTTIEFAMGLLLNHPNEMEKARAEIETEVGHEQLMEDADLEKLEYLQKIYTETTRLFPFGQLLVPHESSEDCTINGYHVPRGTELLVNAWTIQRDPNLWENPTKFMPERFESGKSGFEGYKMIPFGVGRRACPGAALGKRLLGMILGALIQCFDWEKIDGKEIDMTRGLHDSLVIVEPLKALCKPRRYTRAILGMN